MQLRLTSEGVYRMAPTKQPTGICKVHGYHGSAAPLATQLHHVWPLGMGGPDEDENLVEICPTGHVNIHTIIDNLIDGEPTPSAHHLESRNNALDKDRQELLPARPAVLT